MPRGRGGKRQGKPGAQYPNRSDLRIPQPVRVAPSKTYGEGTAQAEAQKAMPLSRSAPSMNVPTGAMAAAESFNFPQLGALDRPSERPDEPVTAGVPVGPGPGPEALAFGENDMPAVKVLSYLSGLPTTPPQVRQRLNQLMLKMR